MVSLKESLRGRISENDIKLVPSSFDIVGSVAIIDIPEEIEKKEKMIAEEMIKLFKPVKTVVKKSGIHYGKYRRQNLEVIAGEKTKVAEYKESGIRLKIDLEKCYFSSRLGTERLRVARLVKPGEKVLVMFSGVAPYPLVIARNAKSGVVYAVEMNPVAHRYAEENVLLNKMQNRIKLFKGDVNDIVPKLKMKFDRILMPMPKTSLTFLKAAFSAAKKGAVIHFYTFGREAEFKEIKRKILGECRTHKRKCKILRTVKAGQYAPGVFRVCVDFKVL